jgi:hypothetical protein
MRPRRFPPNYSPTVVASTEKANLCCKRNAQRTFLPLSNCYYLFINKQDNMGRGKKYDSVETEKLCLAWCHASNNPVVGNEQKSGSFWNEVQQKFVALTPANYVPGTYKDREATALQKYLQKHVFPSVNKFPHQLCRVKEAKLTGGLSDLELINIAVALHLGKIKEPLYDYRKFESEVHWPYYTAWLKVLRLEPKWKPPGLGSTITDSNNANGSDDVVGEVGEQGTGSSEETRSGQKIRRVI